MKDHRHARLNEQLKREVSFVLSRKVRDPRVNRVTVTEARVTPDLSYVRLFVRTPTGDTAPDEVMKALDRAAPFIRRELGKVLRIRHIPELRFVHDTTLDSALRIEAVLKEVLPEGESDENEGSGVDDSGESQREEDGEG